MTLKKQSILTFFALAMSMVLLMSFGPKPKLKGIWYCCSESGYLEMHIKNDKFHYAATWLDKSPDFRYRLKSDTMFIKKLNEHDVETNILSVISLKGKDTLNFYYPETNEYWTFYRSPKLSRENKKSAKGLNSTEIRSKQYNCPEPKPDSFIYFQF